MYSCLFYYLGKVLVCVSHSVAAAQATFFKKTVIAQWINYVKSRKYFCKQSEPNTRGLLKAAGMVYLAVQSGLESEF